MPATPSDFISELTQALDGILAPAFCVFGQAKRNERANHVVINFDANDVDPEMEHTKAMVAMRCTFDCLSTVNSVQALQMASQIRTFFHNLPNGELVPGGNVKLELAERTDFASAPIYDGAIKFDQVILTYLFMYLED